MATKKTKENIHDESGYISKAALKMIKAEEKKNGKGSKRGQKGKSNGGK